MSIQVAGFDLEDFDGFVGACRTVLEYYGTHHESRVRGVTSYMQDGGISLVCDGKQHLQVRLSFHRGGKGERGEPLRPLINPVIEITHDGEIIRSHSEWTYARERIAAYLIRMQDWVHDKKKIKQLTLDEFRHATLFSHYALG